MAKWTSSILNAFYPPTVSISGDDGMHINDSTVAELQQMAQRQKTWMAGGAGGNVYHTNIPSSGSVNIDNVFGIAADTYRMNILRMRMRLREDEKFPFDTIVTGLSGEKVFVMVCVKGQAIVLEDDAAMYPSDELITKLRLIG